MYAENQMSNSIKTLLDPSIPYWQKYFLVLDLVIWALFDTSFSSDLEMFIPGKAVTSICMIVGVAFNISLIVQILNITNTVHAPRMKYYGVMNQLDAYMKMKQFPLHLQKRLKFFYKKKFRQSYYREDEIMGILSGE